MSPFFLILTVVAFMLYFLPSIVAYNRSKRNTAGIVILNLLLGWTCLGWIAALIWAVCQDGKA